MPVEEESKGEKKRKPRDSTKEKTKKNSKKAQQDVVNAIILEEDIQDFSDSDFDL